LKEQRERRLLVEHLLAHYNEGRSMSFYCAACALMPPDLMLTGMLASKQVDGSDPKAKTMKSLVQGLASKADIDLKLRRKRGGGN